MSTDRIQYLLQRLFQKACTAEEKEELALWIDTLHDDKEWKVRLGKIWNSYVPNETIDPEKADTILKDIISRSEKPMLPAKIVTPFYKRWPAAAAVALLIAASLVYFLRAPSMRGRVSASGKPSGYVKDITPGGNRAVLTLSNGTKITLDSMQNGSLAQSGNTKIIKVKSGLLTYEAKSLKRKAQSTISYNTLTTPRGGQYQLVLPDGSKVWLNAASSLQFPTAFPGKERRVQVTGEAYFEITKNAKMPFIVDITSPEGVAEGTVKVLGTHFNINAYHDESVIKTTLLEGAVKIANTSPAGNTRSGLILSSGEQAMMNNNGSVKIIKDVNVNETIAWKNGLFDFEGNDIQSVMREISRWYDVEVKYENISSAHFMGTISRNVNISEVLRMLEMTGAVHFSMEERTITVM